MGTRPVHDVTRRGRGWAARASSTSWARRPSSQSIPSPVTAEIAGKPAVRAPRLRGEVGPRTDHQAGPLEQLRLVLLELCQQHALLLGRLAPVIGCHVHQDQQDPGPFDVAQELVPQALALARPFDQPGDVGHHELVLVEAHHAQVGLQGGERVAGDLGLGRRDGAR